MGCLNWAANVFLSRMRIAAGVRCLKGDMYIIIEVYNLYVLGYVLDIVCIRNSVDYEVWDSIAPGIILCLREHGNHLHLTPLYHPSSPSE
jgi:hypothetical protein